MRNTFIFDFDGTLADSLFVVGGLYNKIGPWFGARNIAIENWDEQKNLEPKDFMKLNRLNFVNIPILLYIIQRKIHSKIKEIKPFEGIETVLEYLKTKGVTLGILTSNSEPNINLFLEKHNLSHYFKFVHSEPNLFGKDKALLKILKIYNLKLDEVIYIGDEPRDIIACHKAKIPIIAVSWGFAGVEILRKNNPEFLVETPLEIVQNLNKIQEWK